MCISSEQARAEGQHHTLFTCAKPKIICVTPDFEVTREAREKSQLHTFGNPLQTPGSENNFYNLCDKKIHVIRKKIFFLGYMLFGILFVSLCQKNIAYLVFGVLLRQANSRKSRKQMSYFPSIRVEYYPKNRNKPCVLDVSFCECC